MRLKTEMLEKLKGNLGLRKKVMAALNVTRTTMWKYLDENDDNLTKAASLHIIAQHYNLDPKDILEPLIPAAQ